MKEFLFTIHMYGKARAEDKAELKDVECSVAFDREGIAVETMEVEINSVADVDESGNACRHRYATPVTAGSN